VYDEGKFQHLLNSQSDEHFLLPDSFLYRRNAKRNEWISSV
jgi:hypothetical protein